MATLYAAICKDCRQEFEIISGPLMAGIQKVCDTCGDSICVPNFAPGGSYELSKLGLSQYMESGTVCVEGREFSYNEQCNLDNLTRGCTCGGKMVEDDDDGSVKHRCPECRSANLDLQWGGCAD